MEKYIETKNLAVGYNGRVIIENIDLSLEKGAVLSVIGPNGAGKSTLLKTIARQLEAVCGTVYICGREHGTIPAKDFARELSVMLTDRACPELTSCIEIVSMGRYPHTGLFGKLRDEDGKALWEALELVNVTELAYRDFSTLSDGQRQRVLLARAICQSPEVIVLDEPTAYLDIRHKIELLELLRKMARERKTTVIMSLHEIELAAKASDYLLCLKGDSIEAFGPADEVLEKHSIESLYSLENGSYNKLFGSVELSAVWGKPKAFVIAGGGYGAACYRALQRRGISFATGPLFENDVDFQLAAALSCHVISTPAFEPVEDEAFEKAAELMENCAVVIDAGTPIGSYNSVNLRLFKFAEEKGIPVYKADEEKLWNTLSQE